MTATYDAVGPLPTGTLVLEASAGTGKTTAIAELVARYVVEAGIDLSRIMIATFSGASTRELRGRVRDQLESVERALSQGRGHDQISQHLLRCEAGERQGRLARARTALAGFDAATICTTHQFCDRMLSELGVLVDHEAGTVLTDDLSSLLEQTVADVYLARYLDVERPPFDLTTAALIARHAAVLSPSLALAPDKADGVAGERVTFAATVRHELEKRKRKLGLYTFDDMQLRLRDALHSSHGDLARALVQRRFPVVLIDEFQDTDPVQWDIVRQAFIGASTVVLIGDPKQSIYGFRGADVYAYLAAVSDATVQALDTNYRSDPRVVTAVSRLFDGAELGDPRITVGPVRTATDTPALVTDGPWREAFRLRHLPDSTGYRAANALIDADLVADVAQLLASATQVHRPRHGSMRALRASDVAVIVSSNRRGEALRQRLSEAGIPCVFNGSSSVLGSQAALDWQTVLVAFARPRTREVRAVALTDFVGWTPADLATADDAALGDLAQQVRRWSRLAAQHGVAALFEVMTGIDGVSRRLLAHRGGDRVVTDLRHVAELLHAQQSRNGLGMAQLLDWLDDQMVRSRTSRDERSRRLETDSDAVQVMTVHQAKGMQYPVVYVPEMTTHQVFRNARHPEPFQVHLGSGADVARVLDVGGEAAPGAAARRSAHEAEEAGERLRWLYVALTRAECHVTAWWVPTTDRTEAAPLHRVLFRDTTTPVVPPTVPCDERRPADVTRLSGSGIIIEAVGQVQSEAQPDLPTDLAPAVELSRTVDLTWRRTSYSALTAGTHHEVAEGTLLTDEPPDPADAVPPELGSLSEPPAGSDGHLDRLSPMAELPGGVAFGSLVHAVFEPFDPTDLDSLASIVAHETRRLPVADVSDEALVAALLPALHTPLGAMFGGRRLLDIPAADRLPELDFELPLGRRSRATRPASGDAATMAEIADLIAAHLPAHDPLVDYPGRLGAAGMSLDPLRGFLTGSIDAAIRVDDAVVVVDYKTNRLAPPGVPLTLGHYTAAAMAEAMMASHYPLQALLYEVALHRFLRWRWRGYEPERHLGGAAYLFVRGMAGPDTPVVDGMPTGVFTWRPPAALITGLSDLLAGAGTPRREERR